MKLGAVFQACCFLLCCSVALSEMVIPLDGGLLSAKCRPSSSILSVGTNASINCTARAFLSVQVVEPLNSSDTNLSSLFVMQLTVDVRRSASLRMSNLSIFRTTAPVRSWTPVANSSSASITTSDGNRTRNVTLLFELEPSMVTTLESVPNSFGVWEFTPRVVFLKVINKSDSTLSDFSAPSQDGADGCHMVVRPNWNLQPVISPPTGSTVASKTPVALTALDSVLPVLSLDAPCEASVRVDSPPGITVAVGSVQLTANTSFSFVRLTDIPSSLSASMNASLVKFAQITYRVDLVCTLPAALVQLLLREQIDATSPLGIAEFWFARSNTVVASFVVIPDMLPPVSISPTDSSRWVAATAGRSTYPPLDVVATIPFVDPSSPQGASSNVAAYLRSVGYRVDMMTQIVTPATFGRVDLPYQLYADATSVGVQVLSTAYFCAYWRIVTNGMTSFLVSQSSVQCSLFDVPQGFSNPDAYRILAAVLGALFVAMLLDDCYVALDRALYLREVREKHRKVAAQPMMSAVRIAKELPPLALAAPQLDSTRRATRRRQTSTRGKPRVGGTSQTPVVGGPLYVSSTELWLDHPGRHGTPAATMEQEDEIVFVPTDDSKTEASSSFHASEEDPFPLDHRPFTSYRKLYIKLTAFTSALFDWIPIIANLTFIGRCLAVDSSHLDLLIVMIVVVLSSLLTLAIRVHVTMLSLPSTMKSDEAPPLTPRDQIGGREQRSATFQPTRAMSHGGSRVNSSTNSPQKGPPTSHDETLPPLAPRGVVPPLDLASLTQVAAAPQQPTPSHAQGQAPGTTITNPTLEEQQRYFVLYQQALEMVAAQQQLQQQQGTRSRVADAVARVQNFVLKLTQRFTLRPAALHSVTSHFWPGVNLFVLLWEDVDCELRFTQDIRQFWFGVQRWVQDVPSLVVVCIFMSRFPRETNAASVFQLFCSISAIAFGYRGTLTAAAVLVVSFLSRLCFRGKESDLEYWMRRKSGLHTVDVHVKHLARSAQRPLSRTNRTFQNVQPGGEKSQYTVAQNLPAHNSVAQNSVQQLPVTTSAQILPALVNPMESLAKPSQLQSLTGTFDEMFPTREFSTLVGEGDPNPVGATEPEAPAFHVVNGNGAPPPESSSSYPEGLVYFDGTNYWVPSADGSGYYVYNAAVDRSVDILDDTQQVGHLSCGDDILIDEQRPSL